MGANYAKMPFSELFHTVFTDDGQVHACGRTACIAFMERMEDVTGLCGKYGDTDTGYLSMPHAYLEGLKFCNQ